MRMTCRDLYAREPQFTIAGEGVFGALGGCYFDHMPEVDGKTYGSFAPSERVTVRVVHYTDFDGRRYWQLATVWLDDEPFMVIQNAGREGDDHYARFVTDAERYGEAVRYLASLALADPEPGDVVDPDEPRDDLDTFYGDSLITAPATALRYLDDRVTMASRIAQPAEPRLQDGGE